MTYATNLQKALAWAPYWTPMQNPAPAEHPTKELVRTGGLLADVVRNMVEGHEPTPEERRGAGHVLYVWEQARVRVLSELHRPASTIPSGWAIERADTDKAHLISITAPNGEKAVISDQDQNIKRVLYMLADALLTNRKEGQ